MRALGLVGLWALPFWMALDGATFASSVLGVGAHVGGGDVVVGGVANVAAPNGTGGGGSTLRGEHSRNGRYQGGSYKPWRGQNSVSWGNAPKDLLGGGFGMGGFSPA